MAEDPINDSMDFLSNRKPIDDMVNRYANNNTQVTSKNRGSSGDVENNTQVMSKQVKFRWLGLKQG